MTNEELATEIDRLIDLLSNDCGGWADTTTKKDFDSALFKLSGAFADSYANQKIGSAQTLVDVLFSARKHEQYEGGAGKVRLLMLHDLSNAKRTLR